MHQSKANEDDERGQATLMYKHRRPKPKVKKTHEHLIGNTMDMVQRMNVRKLSKPSNNLLGEMMNSTATETVS